MYHPYNVKFTRCTAELDEFLSAISEQEVRPTNRFANINLELSKKKNSITDLAKTMNHFNPIAHKTFGLFNPTGGGGGVEICHL